MKIVVISAKKVRSNYRRLKPGLERGPDDVVYREKSSIILAAELRVNIQLNDKCVSEKFPSILNNFAGRFLRDSKQGSRQIATNLVDFLADTSFEVKVLKR